MTVSAGQVRSALGAASRGGRFDGAPDVWNTLVTRGALEGSPDAPQLTPIGRHVLAELELRAYRADAMTIDAVAEHLLRVQLELDRVAKTAEYFLAELGPVAPAEALPYLRPVAVELANRPEPPEEIAVAFRRVWGSVEVMGGDPRDRLLAAQLLTAESADLEHLYAPMMTTTSWIRDTFGETSTSVAPAAILHLHTPAGGKPALEAFTSLRKTGISMEEAALLATDPAGGPAALAAREAMAAALGVAATDPAASAATFLVALGFSPARAAPRVRAIAASLADRVSTPLPAAALLHDVGDLEPPELNDWATKAVDVARRRQLAPSEPELAALGVALVHGLPRNEFGPVGAHADEGRAESAAVLATHRWIYRPAYAAATAA